jgi:hypothetical protein
MTVKKNISGPARVSALPEMRAGGLPSGGP